MISVEEPKHLTPPAPDRLPLVVFLESLHVDGLDLEREPDSDRDIEL